MAFNGLMAGLFVGWFLSLFNFDNMLVKVAQQLLPNLMIIVSWYYVLFALFGLIVGIVESFSKNA